MHVQIVKQPENSSIRKSIDNKNAPLPKNVISLPHFEYEEKRSKETASGGESPSKMIRTRKLNDWMSQLDNALNNPNANSMTVVEKSKRDPISERLVIQTGTGESEKKLYSSPQLNGMLLFYALFIIYLYCLH